MRALLLLATGALLALPACSAKQTPPNRTASRCEGKTLSFDDVLARCVVPGLVEPERIAPASPLELHARLSASSAGQPIGVELRLVNTSDGPLGLDLVGTEIEPDPRPVLLMEDGFRVPNDMDASCTNGTPAPSGGLGVRERGERSIARITLPPGGTLAAKRSVASRNGLCVCAPDAQGVLDTRCTVGGGAPVQPGAYNISVSMPVAVTREDGLGRYGYPHVRTPVALVAASDEGWPEE